MANHRYLAVISPNFLAIGIGNRMNGIENHVKIPLNTRLKHLNKSHRRNVLPKTLKNV